MMKKHAANLITSVRVLLAPLLFFLSEITGLFFAIYLTCAVSDLLDGPVARMTKSTGITGSILDTVGDTLMYTGMMKVVLSNYGIPVWSVVWLAAALALHFISALIAAHRFGVFYFAHTISSKIMGGMFFLTPFMFCYGLIRLHMLLISMVATYSAVEAIIVQRRMKIADSDVRSAYSLRQSLHVEDTTDDFFSTRKEMA